VRAIKSNLFINVSRSYSPNAILVVENAVIAADRAGHASLEPIHLFISLLEDKEVAVLFARAGLPVAGLIDRADRAVAGITEMEKHADAALSPGFSPRFWALMPIHTRRAKKG